MASASAASASAGGGNKAPETGEAQDKAAKEKEKEAELTPQQLHASNKITARELDWMEVQRPLVLDPKQLAKDHGDKVWEEMRKAFEAAGPAFVKLMPALMWPGVSALRVFPLPAPCTVSSCPVLAPLSSIVWHALAPISRLLTVHRHFFLRRHRHRHRHRHCRRRRLSFQLKRGGSRRRRQCTAHHTARSTRSVWQFAGASDQLSQFGADRSPVPRH
jgi:hypothetical protein